MKEKMKETEMELKELKMLEEQLKNALKAELAGGLQNVNTEEAGEVIDMMKDLSEIKKNCMESLFYEAKMKDMQDDNERERHGYIRPDMPYIPPMQELRGYNWMTERENRRESFPEIDYNSRGYSSNSGNSGSSGGGYNSGDMRGYDASQKGNNARGGGTRGYSEYFDARYGEPYNLYEQSRRNYQSSKSQDDMKEMEKHMDEHISDMVITVKRMYKDAEPHLKEEIKKHMTKLVEELE